MPDRPKPQLTLLGMPAFVPGDEEPFPLTAYADVHVYTPSRERTVTAPLPPDRRGMRDVILPPASPVARKLDPTAYLRAVTPGEPSFEAKMVACSVVLWVLCMGTIYAMFW